ncbi:hypothetical protein NPIL_42891 [Nephila pilipes]|uniref:Uncharacterized protein n=1 Tax=Nephila pilipes TaxID=299642 RepID=A0A8X6NRI9_NEPPI|nr:hypothetical protein NPIL_42891 [Nephila pilipes]
MLSNFLADFVHHNPHCRSFSSGCSYGNYRNVCIELGDDSFPCLLYYCCGTTACWPVCRKYIYFLFQLYCA